MPAPVATRILNGCRWAALLLSLAGAATVAIYQWRPEWVAGLDRALEQRWFAGPQDRLLAAAQALPADPAGAGAALAALRESHRGYLPGDRQEAIYRVASLLLAQAELAQGRRDGAAVLLAEVTAARPQDLAPALARIDLLLGAPATAEQGRRALAELFALLPEQWEVTHRLLAADAAAADRAAVAADLARHLLAPQPWLFTLAYDSAEPGDAAMRRAYLSVSIAPDGRLAAPFRLPGGAAAARLELPRSGWFELRDLQLHIEGQLAPVAATADGDLVLADGALHCLGGSAPAVIFRLAEPVAQGGARCRILGQWHFLPPGHLAPWLEEPRFGAMLLACERRGANAEAARLRRAMGFHAFDQGCTLTVADGRGAMAEPIAARPRFGPAMDQGIPFTVSLPVGTDSARLQFAPPARPGITFAIDSLRLQTAGGETAATLQGVELTDLEETAAGYRITGPAPRLLVGLPAVQGPAQVLLRGWIR